MLFWRIIQNVGITRIELEMSSNYFQHFFQKSINKIGKTRLESEYSDVFLQKIYSFWEIQTNLHWNSE